VEGEVEEVVWEEKIITTEATESTEKKSSPQRKEKYKHNGHKVSLRGK
jgi:hypothetical protein